MLLLVALIGSIGACSGSPPVELTDAPSSSPTDEPTPSLAVTPEPLPVSVVDVSATVPQNGNAAISVETVPDADCRIEVRYESGPSEAEGLSPVTADSAGRANWTWQVGQNTTLGTYPIVVECRLGESVGSHRNRVHSAVMVARSDWMTRG